MVLGKSDGGEAYTSLDRTLNIPDDMVTGITSARYVTDSHSVETLSIDLGITHTDMGEITVVLTSPAGTSLTIYDGDNTGQTDFNNNIGWEVDFNTGNLNCSSSP